MKKLLMLLTCLLFASSVYALTNSTLIDFSLTGDVANLQDDPNDTNSVVKVSENLFNNNWVVWLNDSANLVQNRRLTFASNVDSKGNNGQWDAGKVLGIRIHFPVEKWNSYATIKPIYDIEMYSGENGQKYANGKGVIHNVMTIKTISSWVYGRNFNITYFIGLKNEKNAAREYPMGSLYFNGWRQLKWENPSYLNDARDRELVRAPLYPRMAPSVKFDYMKFYRSKDIEGGDFITYVKNITIDYDPMDLVVDEDINDEGTWQIIKTENERRQALENAAIKENQELRSIENKRMENANSATTTPAQ